ncbi:MAG TPA: UTRA domain-containing protein [Steroidobacteraceae bacterium]|nr:UTRA domain-containing protein [Steroidobacteraceae bacterium]
MTRSPARKSHTKPAGIRSGRTHGPVAPALDGEGPIWLQIRRALAGPIMSGTWPPGTRIPTEASLTRTFGTSRMTVGKAIQSLASEGLVQRRRKIGTMVAARPLERPVFEIWDIADIVTRSGGTYEYHLLECRALEDEAERRELLGVSSRTPVLWMRCLHLRDDEPFQLEERLINIDAAPGVRRQRFQAQGPGRWLLGHVPWTDAEHRISAREASAGIATDLKVQPQTACLVVDRRTWNHGAPVTHARLWHPGASYNLVGHFKPQR